MGTKSDIKAQARDLAEHCLAARVRLLSRVVTRLYESHMGDSELTIGQINMLAAMLCLGPDKADASILSEILQMEKSTVSRNLTKMGARGWIVRHPPAQGRRESIELTPTGLQEFSRAYPGWRAAQQEASDRLSDELINSLMAAFSPPSS